MARQLLQEMTPEQQAAAVAKRNATKAANRARLRSHFLDEGYWERIADEAGIKLPPYGVPCTPGKMAKWLGILGIPVEAFLYWLNGKRLAEWIALNPTWPLKAMVGITLEHRDFIMGQWNRHQA